MAEKAFFYNALPDESSATGYDRNYNADDISDWLSTVFDTGVVKSDEGLKVVASSGMTVNVNVGKACILGKPYYNTSLKSLTVGTAPTGNTARYDLVVLQYNNEVATRHTRLLIRQTTLTGLSTDAVIESLLNRSEKIFEICIAVIRVAPNTTSITQSDIYDKRGNTMICPWFTAVKGYDDYYDAIVQSFEYTETLDSLSKTVYTNIASRLYNEKYSQVEVFTNGLKEPSDAYEVITGGTYIVINFTANRSAGAVVNVCLNNYIDGEGMSTALAQYSEWANAVATLQTAGEYDYLCNGVDDNVQISNIVKAYLAGGTDYGSVKLNVIGNIGMSTPARGDGSMTTPFGWFDFAQSSNRRIILDFTRCGQISPSVASGKYSHVFYAPNGIQVIGANVLASNTATDTIIRLVETSDGVVLFENCRIWINGYKNCLLSTRGTFKYCRGSVANVTENSYCFLPSGYGTVKVVGGEYYAYTGDSVKQSAIVGQSSANSVSILYGVSAPTSGRTGFYQTHSLLQWTGGGVMNCTDLVSALPMIVVSGISNIRGTIELSKTNVL
jgi:hypothetical protein